MRATAEDTQKEIQRLRLSQELSAVEMRLANAQAEHRALKRNNDKKQSKAVKSQLAQLEREVGALNGQRMQIQNSLTALNPAPTEPAGTRASMASSFDKGQATGNRMMGCLGWAALWLTLFMLIGSLLINVAGEAGAVIAMVLSTVIVIYAQRRRKRKTFAA